MKTKTLIVYLNNIDCILEKIIDRNSTEEEVKKNLYKYTVYTDLFCVILTHWKNIKMSYDYNFVSTKVDINMMKILNETENKIKEFRPTYNYTHREYWNIIRNDLK